MIYVSRELAYILNLRNTAIDHKKHCDTNCNVSIGELRQTAIYIKNYLTNGLEIIEATKYIEEMPIG